MMILMKYDKYLIITLNSVIIRSNYNIVYIKLMINLLHHFCLSLLMQPFQAHASPWQVE